MDNILLVEDTLDIRMSLKRALTKEGYQVYAVESGEDALKLIMQHVVTFDMLLLDLLLPGMGGEDFLKFFQQKYDVPVLVISALSSETTQIEMYKLKVDDYIIKPFSINIILLKIEVILRRSKLDQRHLIHYQGVTLFVDNYSVLYNNEEIELTTKEFELLQAMLVNQGKVFTRQELLEAIWGYDFMGDSRTVDVHIKNLRKKLYPELITTIKGVGYKIEKERIK
ncbi:response regulator transcription factor [Enterococcus faecalis]|uniref:response regulator transcription factor n=1 Tax=Enterococcus faecalis TaxID=1351 RepID=UPI0031CCF6C9